MIIPTVEGTVKSVRYCFVNGVDFLIDDKTFMIIPRPNSDWKMRMNLNKAFS